MNQSEALQQIRTLFPDRETHSAQESMTHSTFGGSEYRREFVVFIHPGYDGLCSLGTSDQTYEDAIQKLADGYKKHMEFVARSNP